MSGAMRIATNTTEKSSYRLDSMTINSPVNFNACSTLIARGFIMHILITLPHSGTSI